MWCIHADSEQSTAARAERNERNRSPCWRSLMPIRFNIFFSLDLVIIVNTHGTVWRLSHNTLDSSIHRFIYWNTEGRSCHRDTVQIQSKTKITGLLFDFHHRVENFRCFFAVLWLFQVHSMQNDGICEYTKNNMHFCFLTLTFKCI